MDLKIKRLLIGLLSCLCVAGIVIPFSQNVMASEASVVFGSDYYENESGAEFPIGVYIDGDEDIGYYRVEIEYDVKRLKYLEGATEGKDGLVIFEGVGNDVRVSTMLRFQALSGGDTEIKISDARVLLPGGANETFEIKEMAKVPIKLSGEDTVKETASQETSAAGDETKETEEETKKENTDAGSYTGIFIVAGILSGILAAILLTLGIRKKIRKNGISKERKKNARKNLEKISGSGEIHSPGVNTVDLNVKTSDVPPADLKFKNMSDKAEKNSDNINAGSKSLVKEFLPKADTSLIPTREIIDEAEKGKPVIEIKNVTMEFKTSSGRTSGLKDYVIQKAKRKIKRKRFRAVNNISFKVYKGEVVGIIGTNGSGKSTLLKIVSGALNPTKGEVIADKDKIQLLTLGTGFDGELSAKENVYLNGAIIGYTKDFINKHYDEIVEFAELEDFMEEKVKNFSSGMISRLGFSIATVGGAAEILILDEILSVGDQFFRQKSMERIKEMIHGGSTVLIVSHSLPTIREHCDKVVWIDKGELRMIGDPRSVCNAYSKLQEV